MIWRLWVQFPVGVIFYFALLHQCWQDPVTIWQEMLNYGKTRMNAESKLEMGRTVSSKTSNTMSFEMSVEKFSVDPGNGRTRKMYECYE